MWTPSPIWPIWLFGLFGYLAGVLAGGVSGFLLAIHAFGGPVARSGFAGLAGLWLVTGASALRAVRRWDIAAHRAWMTRNYALTFAAVTLRIYLPLLLAFGVPFPTAYPIAAWACWVPNLLFVEGRARRSRGAAPCIADRP